MCKYRPEKKFSVLQPVGCLSLYKAIAGPDFQVDDTDQATEHPSENRIKP